MDETASHAQGVGPQSAFHIAERAADVQPYLSRMRPEDTDGYRKRAARIRALPRIANAGANLHLIRKAFLRTRAKTANCLVPLFVERVSSPRQTSRES